MIKIKGISFSAGFIVAAFIVGGIVGWGARSITTANSLSPLAAIPGISSDTNASVDQLTLRNLFMQHNALLTLYLEGFYDGKDVSSLDSLLQDNGKQIANFIGARYGWSAQNDFVPMWNNHLSEYKSYAYALKNNDSVAMDNAKKNLYDVAAAMGDYFHRLNPNFLAPQVSNMMGNHINLVLSILYAYGHQDQTTMLRQIQKEEDQALQFASYLGSFSASSRTNLY